METDSNKLNDDFLAKTNTGADKDGNDDFVHDNLPLPTGCATLEVVVDHNGEEGYQNGEGPEEQGSGKLQLLAHVPPFLAIVCAETCDQAYGVWQSLGKDPTSPQRQPYNLEPHAEPEEANATNGRAIEKQGAQ